MAIPRLHARVSLAVLVACVPVVSQADLYSLKIENDVIATGSDGHYTNGFELMRSFEPDADHWSRQFADVLPGWRAAEVDSVAYRLGHQIYTPNDIERTELIEDDRPYAGLLFAGMSIFSGHQYEGWRSASGLHLDVGIVGPAAGGKKIQRRVHEVTDSDEPKGWDNQLRNEPFVNLAYQHRWWLQQRFAGLEFEYGPSAGFSLGNLYTYGSAGLGLRIGQGLARSFSIPAVAPAQSGSMFFTRGGGFAWNIFANVEGRYMAQNMLLEGNTFKSSHSVDPNEWVGDAKAGIALTWNTWQLAFASVWRTREFHGQDEHDQFGSLTVSTWF
ncbi:lipid A deacylase LpxR family protein [Pseudomonas sp. KSR10]|jgi:lipid A 3-O-deacylase|uniref:lipid A deacylase LpxR family protein n=1 Tax=Pseudomonadaceae TaxID=135621 RepID=UPI000B1B29FE|nr:MULTISPECIES: lipid A deacylase LpxR family protein [Pseudomonadaceae]MCG6539088.1 lipid A deacylase LpxR family protein [Pseudomonas sp. KSR10]